MIRNIFWSIFEHFPFTIFERTVEPIITFGDTKSTAL